MRFKEDRPVKIKSSGEEATFVMYFENKKGEESCIVKMKNGNTYSYKEEDLLPLEQEKIKSGFYEQKGKKIGQLVDKKQEAYGNSVESSVEIIKVFMKKYKNHDGTYTIPGSLIPHLLYQVRIIDKQSRIFNNPDGDLMEENTYQDITGYGMLGGEKAYPKGVIDSGKQE